MYCVRKSRNTAVLNYSCIYNVRTKISNMFSTLASKNPKHFFLHLDMKVFQVKDDALTNLNESIFENHDCTKAGLIKSKVVIISFLNMCFDLFIT